MQLDLNFKVNIMGASKRIIEDLVMAYNGHFKVTTTRFANVAFDAVAELNW